MASIGNYYRYNDLNLSTVEQPPQKRNKPEVPVSEARREQLTSNLVQKDGCTLEHVEVALAYLVKQKGGYPDALRRKARILCCYLEQRGNVRFDEEVLERECPFEFVDFVFRLQKYKGPMEQLAKMSCIDPQPLIDAVTNQRWDEVGTIQHYEFVALEALRRRMVTSEECAAVLLHWSFAQEYGLDGFEVITSAQDITEHLAASREAHNMMDKPFVELDATSVPSGSCLFIAKREDQYGHEHMWMCETVIDTCGPQLFSYRYNIFERRGRWCMPSPSIVQYALQCVKDPSFPQAPRADFHVGQDLWCDRYHAQQRAVPQLMVGLSFPENIRPSVHGSKDHNLASIAHDVVHALIFATIPYFEHCQRLDSYWRDFVGSSQSSPRSSAFQQLYRQLIIDHVDDELYKQSLKTMNADQYFKAYIVAEAFQVASSYFKGAVDEKRQFLIGCFQILEKAIPGIGDAPELWREARLFASRRLGVRATPEELEKFFPVDAIVDAIQQERRGKSLGLIR